MPQINKLIRMRTVVEITGLSKSYIYSLYKENLFPKPVPIVPGGTAVAWVEKEVHDWIAERIAARN